MVGCNLDKLWHISLAYILREAAARVERTAERRPDEVGRPARDRLDAVEERNPPHFHVAVFPQQYASYVGNRGGAQLASSTPAARPASSARASAARRYEVRRGDSLWTIARRNNVSVAQLRDANSLRGSRIMAGQVLVIPEAR